MKKQQLRKRIITATVLATLVVVGIFFVPAFEFALISAAVFAIGGWEWAKLINFSTFKSRISYVIILLVAFALTQYIPSIVIFISAIAWWLMALSLIMRYPQSKIIWRENKFIPALIGFLVLVPCWLGINKIHSLGGQQLLYALFIVWSTDTGAFIIGHRWGKNKLAPNVSPGKTMEGFFGGLGLALVVAFIGAALLQVPTQKYLAILLLAVFVSIAAVIGDLFESMLKRLAGVKDSGNWLPGHGGLLDRIDSLTAAIPVFALMMVLIWG